MIAPFPENIDRIAFGWYVSGFTDGEGCFSLFADCRTRRGKKQERPTPSASFAINLRRDDIGILELIQSYFRCGAIVYGKTRHLCLLRFRKLEELDVIVKHFEVFTLLAKKKNDFAVWRDGVRLMLMVSRIKQRRSQMYGAAYKWSSDSHAFFMSLKQELEDGRKFKEVSDEENSVRDPSQSHIFLDPNMRGVSGEESAAR